jgi:aminopeptidase
MDSSVPTFPRFSLSRLLNTVFAPKGGERVAILIDLENPKEVVNFAFLQNPTLTIQRHAYEVFYRGLDQKGLQELHFASCDLFAYRITGGSNLDLPDEAYSPEGRQVSLEKDVYPNYDLILCISTFSATAPLTAFAKKFGFRGATLHGLNDIILRSGLSVDYNEVSRQAEKLRLGLTRADWFEIDFKVGGKTYTLKLVCNGQEAQKSHGLCRGPEADVANLPAGEVYYVPEGAEGQFPMRYEDGTLALMDVGGGRIQKSALLHGSQEAVDAHNAKLKSDPMTGELGELGFGTQVLPVSGRDIQDEKVLGTMHVATGRSDHLGGHLVPELFKNAKNATHDDILYSPAKTPEIVITQVRMQRDGKSEVVLENFQPAPYLRKLLEG